MKFNIAMPKGLYEVITSPKHDLKTKIEVVERFTWPVHHLDGKYKGLIEPGIAREDADLIIKILEGGECSE